MKSDRRLTPAEFRRTDKTVLIAAALRSRKDSQAYFERLANKLFDMFSDEPIPDTSPD